MLVNREKYLSKIRPFYDLDIIKVLMGSRRSGKSPMNYDNRNLIKRVLNIFR